MKGIFEIGNTKCQVDFSKGNDISIPLNFNGEQPNTYGVDIASSAPYKDGKFIGDTRKGGPCNFETYSFTPHCNGTHTECIGHITDERIDILSSLNDEMIPSTLVSVTPKNTNENYTPDLNTEDLVITKEDLELQLKGVNPEFLKGVIIRTSPNSENKKSRDYMKETPSFFSIEAMEYLVSLGIQHLLVDTPSVDRLFDDGHLSAHNIFWETKGKAFNLNTQNKTITEMIFAPDYLEDGAYLLNLQIPAFVSDAAPSRPILYKINEL
ncbi:MAG: cyclase family protein [Flavobacteriales bacterium]|jgi:arylformamidase|nr:cyclase family protein [Flavobacteriales bacterium]